MSCSNMLITSIIQRAEMKGVVNIMIFPVSKLWPNYLSPARETGVYSKLLHG